LLQLKFAALAGALRLKTSDDSPRKPRDVRLDALRGLFLILMVGVHVPTPLSDLFHDPWGCIGAADGFIFLSACLAGLVYGNVYRKTDWATLRQRIGRRVKLIYGIHLLVLIPTIFVVWAIAGRVAPLAAHFSDFLAHPWGSLALMPLLLHQPPLFDILPLYVVFLAVTPWLLSFARRRGWKRVLIVSFLVWLAAQFKLDSRIFGDPARWLPLRLGSFDLVAWQFLWVCGVALGETSLRRDIIKKNWRAAFALAAALVILPGLAMRYGFWPHRWWNDDYYIWMDKWTLAPVRLLDFAAWVVLLLAWNPRPSARLFGPLPLLGRHSLAVFALHLPLAITAGVIIQTAALSNPLQDAIVIVVLLLLFIWAAWLDQNKRRKTSTSSAAEKIVAPARKPALEPRPPVQTWQTPANAGE
jgi:hypothetical protein